LIRVGQGEDQFRIAGLPEALAEAGALTGEKPDSGSSSETILTTTFSSSLQAYSAVFCQRQRVANERPGDCISVKWRTVSPIKNADPWSLARTAFVLKIGGSDFPGSAARFPDVWRRMPKMLRRMNNKPADQEKPNDKVPCLRHFVGSGPFPVARRSRMRFGSRTHCDDPG